MENFEELNITLKEVIQMSIAFYNPKRIYYPKIGKETVFTPCVNENFEKCYEIEEDIVAFVSDGIFYVIPCWRDLLNVFSKNGFARKSMPIPFLNGSYPVVEKNYWELLQQTAKNQRELDACLVNQKSSIS